MAVDAERPPRVPPITLGPARPRAALSAAMTKRRRFQLFASRCPTCGSTNTRIDWLQLENYRMAVLTTVIAVFTHHYAGRYDRVCRDCGRKFTP